MGYSHYRFTKNKSNGFQLGRTLDTQPYINFLDADDIEMDIYSGKVFEIKENGTAFCNIYADGSNCAIESKNTNAHLRLMTTGTGKLRLPTPRTAVAGEALSHYINALDGDGNAIKIAVVS